jgi:hypothetical protein
MTTLQLAPGTVASPMQRGVVPRSTRRTSVLVAILFLAATVTFAVADGLIAGVLRQPGSLTGAGHAGPLTTGALIACFEGPATIAIAVLLFPLLRRYGERLAFGYIALRVAELAAVALYVATPVLMMQIGDGVRDGSVSPSSAHRLAALMQAQHDLAVTLMYLITGVGGTFLACLLYRSRLVPRWMAVLGLVGYPALLLGSALALLGPVDVTQGAGMVSLLPGGLFELILPLWLLVRGFAPTPET